MSNSSNPLLSNVKLPGRMFQLPSRGLFYDNGELADTVADGEIHVHPMSALDEINMKNPDQLFSGAAIESVSSECVDGILKSKQLLAKDIDALMLFLRTVTYGPTFEFIAKHGCENGKEHSYTADIDQMIANMKYMDATIIEQQYTLTLPNGQVVKLQPNRYQQVIDLIKKNENKKNLSVEDQKENLITMVLGVVKSVNGITNQEQIEEWARKISQPMINIIAQRIDSIVDFGPDLKWKCKCPECGQEFSVEIPINPVSFFTE